MAGGARAVLQFSNAVSPLAPAACSSTGASPRTSPQVILALPDTQATAIDPGPSSRASRWARGSAVTDADGTRRATLVLPAARRAADDPAGRLGAVALRGFQAAGDRVLDRPARAADRAGRPAAGHHLRLRSRAVGGCRGGALFFLHSQPVAFYLENYLGPGVFGQPVNAMATTASRRVYLPGAERSRGANPLGHRRRRRLRRPRQRQPAPPAALKGAAAVTVAELLVLASSPPSARAYPRVPVRASLAVDLLGGGLGGAPRLRRCAGALPTTGEDRKVDHPADSGRRRPDRGRQPASSATSSTWLHGVRPELPQLAWVPGRTAAYTLHVPLTPGVVPAGIASVTVEINEIAGQDVVQTFPATPSSPYDFTWNRMHGWAAGQIQESGAMDLHRPPNHALGGRGSVALLLRQVRRRVGGFDAQLDRGGPARLIAWSASLLRPLDRHVAIAGRYQRWRSLKSHPDHLQGPQRGGGQPERPAAWAITGRRATRWPSWLGRRGSR